MKNPTHILFDETKVIVSPNLTPIVRFLLNIEKEVQSFLSREKKLEAIQKQNLEFMERIEVMGKTIKDSDLDFQISEHQKSIVDKLKFERSDRSEMIVLFAYLETLRCLWTAYEEKVDNDQDLRNASNDKLEIFYKNFCITPENKYFKNNPKRLGQIAPSQLRKLRNSLTHFFSVSNLGIIPYFAQVESKKITKTTKNTAQFISVKDLEEIIEGVFMKMIHRWSDDFQESLNENKSDFEARLHCVIKIVEKSAAVFVYQK